MAAAAAATRSSATTMRTSFPTRMKRFVIVPRRKQRCWIFSVAGVTTDALAGSKVDILASICKRYTTVKRLIVRTASSAGHAAEADPTTDKSVQVEVEFTGPLPSEGPGALLCHLLGGSSVHARPVELPRGRKKRPRSDGASSEPSDSGRCERGPKKNGCHRSTNSFQHASEGRGRGGNHGRVNGVTDKTLVNDDESVGGVAASSGLSFHSSTGLPKTSCSSPQAKLSSISCVVDISDTGTMPELLPPNVPETVSPHSVHQQVQHIPTLDLQHQHPNDIVPHQQHQHQVKASSGGQRNDVVDCNTTPESSCHSLDMGSDDLSTSEHHADGAEIESLLVSTNNGGTWRSNDIQSELFEPIPPPQPVQPPLTGWSFDFDSALPRETVAGDFSSEKLVMELCDVDNSLCSTATERMAAERRLSVASGFSVGRNADTGARSWQEQGVSQHLSFGTEGMLPMEKVMIEPSPKECDFEGRPAPTLSPRSSSLPLPDGQCNMVFTGLENTGHDFCSLRVTAHFEVDAVHKVGESTGPIKGGADGRAYATVCYPSMREIWPELYSLGNVQVIQVNVVVEIRSDCGKYQFVGPQLKVAYRRTPSTRSTSAEPDSLLQGRQLSSRAPTTPYTDDTHQTSLSCEDYSCFDRLSDMCHSVFRGGEAANQPLPDDANGLMNVRP